MNAATTRQIAEAIAESSGTAAALEAIRVAKLLSTC